MTALNSPASSSRARWTLNHDTHLMTWQEIEPVVLLCAAYFQDDFLEEGFVSSCLTYRKDIQNITPLLLQHAPSPLWDTRYLRSPYGSGGDSPSTPTTSASSPELEPNLQMEELCDGSTTNKKSSWALGVDETTRSELSLSPPQTLPNLSTPISLPPPPSIHLAPRTSKRPTRSTRTIKPHRQAACHSCKVKKTRCYRNLQAEAPPLAQSESACAPCLRLGLTCDYSPPPAGSLAHTVGVRRRQQREASKSLQPAKKPLSPTQRPIVRPRFVTPVSAEDFADAPKSCNLMTPAVFPTT